MKTTYDPECERLARHFLEDQGVPVSDAQVIALAAAIQETIEDWWAMQEMA